MIIGIDGCAATGKTTLALALARELNATYVPEYALPPNDAVDRRRFQSHYLHAETARAGSVAGGGVVDRTLLSQVAHVMVAEREHAGEAQAVVQYLRLRGNSAWGVHPDRFLWLRGDHRRNLARLSVREAGNAAEGTEPLLGDIGYMRAFDEALEYVGRCLPSDRFIAAEACPDPFDIVAALALPPSSTWCVSDTVQVLIDCLDAA